MKIQVLRSLGFLGTNAGVVASHQAPEKAGRALSVDAKWENGCTEWGMTGGGELHQGYVSAFL